ncbi:hypothetical protein PXI10_05965 [Campylobacter jejuni]|uniref:hypothetical protein n=1 Tax=Campylobacter jejuni TaxID=197 RepID=UPI0009A38C6B|nr:hypothetical protein [Campylobacter jejuni]MCH3815830.1 hypothetical protein [Campylobacter jejuni]MCH3818866.1 hypothetical protein [Campylobacter jejuni]MDC8084123.1 hypothetical protein [Campylobacter jejuni]WED83700.1 hypothetical protein PXI10_05965 [Campylobacter jejuni]
MNVHIDSNDINTLNQSFDFMEALGSDFTNTYLQNKGVTEIKNILQAKTNIQALIRNVNNLVSIKTPKKILIKPLMLTMLT